jgi:hypothetical protein
MQSNKIHLSDQSLLLAADGELPNRRAAQVRAHLAACWDCRARMAEIETTIVDFVRASRQAVDPCLPPVDRSRALLKARLDDLAGRSQSPGWLQLLFGADRRGIAFAFALILVFIVTARALYERIAGESIDSMAAYSEPLPNPILTPGSVRTVTFSELCSMNHDEVVRRVPGSVRQQVFREYGMENVRAQDYEMDHLITPGLGGSDDIRNLWPEPHYNTEWNSYVKDQLEEHLHHLVCDRQVSLATAQRDIASNWITAYKKYFHSDIPLSSNTISGTADAIVRMPRDMVPTFRRVRRSAGWNSRNRPPPRWHLSLLLEVAVAFVSILLAGPAFLGLGAEFLGPRSKPRAARSRPSLSAQEIPLPTA